MNGWASIEWVGKKEEGLYQASEWESSSESSPSLPISLSLLPPILSLFSAIWVKQVKKAMREPMKEFESEWAEGKQKKSKPKNWSYRGLALTLSDSIRKGERERKSLSLWGRLWGRKTRFERVRDWDLSVFEKERTSCLFVSLLLLFLLPSLLILVLISRRFFPDFPSSIFLFHQNMTAFSDIYI